MSWVRVDDFAPNHPKVEEAVRLSDYGAWGLVAELWCRASRIHKLGGFLPEGTIEAVMRAKRYKPMHRKALEAVGLLVPAEGGVFVHDFDDYRPPRDEPAEKAIDEATEKRRAAARERMRTRREQKRTRGEHDANGSHDVREHDANAESTPSEPNANVRAPVGIAGGACAPPVPSPPRPVPTPEENKNSLAFARSVAPKRTRRQAPTPPRARRRFPGEFAKSPAPSRSPTSPQRPSSRPRGPPTRPSLATRASRQS